MNRTLLAGAMAACVAVAGLAIVAHAKHLWDTTNDTYGMQTLIGCMMVLAAPGVFLMHKEQKDSNK